MALRFPGVEIDPLSEVVRRGGEECRLRQKTFQVLFYLIENRHRVVTRQELFANVWNGTAVTDDALVQSIVEIRKALGDDPRSPRFVRTVPRRGYHFVAAEEDHDVSLRVERETTHSIEYEVVDDAPGARRWLQVAAAAAGFAALAIAAFTMTVGRERPGRSQPLRAEGTSAPHFSVGLTSSPEAQRLYALGVERANAFRTEEAIELLQRAIAIDPEFAMAHARIGYALGVTGPEAHNARLHIARARTLSNRLSERDRMLIDAWEAVVMNDFDLAIDRFRLVIDRYPTDVESHLRLANLLAGEERDEEAIVMLERAKLIDPLRPEIYNALGLYSSVGRHEEAIAARRRYVELRPNEPNAYDSLGISHQIAGQYDEALAAYGRALALRNDFHIARYHRAATLVQLGRFRDAAKDVEAILAANPKDYDRARALTTLSDIYSLKGDQARAVAYARQVEPGKGYEPVLLDIERGATSAQDASLRAAQKFNGRGSRAIRRSDFHLHGTLALRRGEHEKAIRLFQEALRFKPAFWYVDPLETGLAGAYLQIGRAAEALAEYERVLKRAPNLAPALYGRARALEMLGRRSEAMAAYRDFLTLWKDADRDARDWIDASARLARLGA